MGRVLLLCLAVAGVRVASGAAAKPEPGSYSGKVGLFPLHFTVSANGKTVTGMRTDFEATIDCGSPADNPPYFTFGPLTISGAGFHGTTTTGTTKYTVKGTFDGTKASGTMNVISKFLHNALPPCNETDKFTATRT